MPARRSKATTLCHSVFSCFCPVALSFQTSVVAMRSFAICMPDGVAFISGSAPRCPTRMTLLMEPAMLSSCSKGAEDSKGAASRILLLGRPPQPGPVRVGDHGVDGRLAARGRPPRLHVRAPPLGVGRLRLVLHRGPNLEQG